MLISLGVSGSIAAYKACEIVRGLDRAGAGLDATPQRPKDLEGNVLPHLDDVPFVCQRKIGKRRLAKKGTMDDLIPLSQSRRTVRTSTIEIVQEEIQAIGIIA